MEFIECKTTELAKMAAELITNSMLSKNTQRSPKSSVPVIVGAGISASAGVPISSDLIQELARLCPNVAKPEEITNYEDILTALKKNIASNFEGEDAQYKAKVQFAPLLHKAGIPRLEDRPLPNLSNLILYDLAVSGLMGPIISLNVDPLLQMSEILISTDSRSALFIHNVSQFSNADEAINFRNKALIFQPHGTIEEPFSLRFSKSELVSKSLGIVSTIKKFVDKTSGVIVVGANLTDEVVVEMLTTIANENTDSKITIILPIFGSTFEETTRDILRSRFTRTALRGDTGINVYFALNSDSDVFFEQVREKTVESQSSRRRSGSESVALQSFSEIQLRHFIYRKVIEEEGWGEFQVKKLPSLEKQIRTEVFIFAIASRAPFTARALIQWLQAKRYLKESFENKPNEVSRYVQSTLDALQSENVLAVDGIDAEKSNLARLISFDSVRSRLYVRGKVFTEDNSQGRFAEAFLSLVGANVADSSISTELANLIATLEMNREGVFDPGLAFAVAIGLKGAEIIEDHIKLDGILDRAKADFGNWVKTGNNAICRIMTEAGDHLFMKDKLASFYGDPSKLTTGDVRAALRPWLHPIFDAPDSSGASLKIVVAQHKPDWAMRDAERSRFEAVLKQALMILSRRPKVRVYLSPWEKHDDHMFMISGKLKNGNSFRAIAFPRIHGEIKFFGVQTSDPRACKEIEMLYDRNMVRYSTPFEKHKALRPVLAVTIVDASAESYNGITENTEIFVAVRSENTNRQHKNIASVPTRRIIEKVLWEIVKPTPLAILDDTEEVLLDSAMEESGNGASESSPTIMAVDYLLSRKLGIGEALEAGDVKFRARPVILKAGPSPQLSDDDEDEWLIMVNILVEVTRGRAYFPKKCNAYSLADWISVKDFLAAVPAPLSTTSSVPQKKIKFPNGEAAEYICGGLCVCTSSVLINSLKSSQQNLVADVLGSGVT